ncbi:MAG TPA: hypothetical protein VLG47_00180 [Candidatus Saccharimonadales bacterium]|nr:hypothetical protein [Candidatus Saccharimonadales bacterium]
MAASEIRNLLLAYNQKGMSIKSSKKSLKALGYSSKEIDDVIADLNSRAQLTPTVSEKDWNEVSKNIFKEQRNKLRYAAFVPIFAIGFGIGREVFFDIWHILPDSPNCNRPFPINYQYNANLANHCGDYQIDPTWAVVFALATGVAAILVAKFCYIIYDYFKYKKKEMN